MLRRDFWRRFGGSGGVSAGGSASSRLVYQSPLRSDDSGDGVSRLQIVSVRGGVRSDFESPPSDVIQSGGGGGGATSRHPAAASTDAASDAFRDCVSPESFKLPHISKEMIEEIPEEDIYYTSAYHETAVTDPTRAAAGTPSAAAAAPQRPPREDPTRGVAAHHADALLVSVDEDDVDVERLSDDGVTATPLVPRLIASRLVHEEELDSDDQDCGDLHLGLQ